MKLNVVICTHNRAEGLERCLRSLRTQTAPAEDFGILVVDNGSTDDTRAVVERLTAELPNLKYHYDPVPSVAKARNTGLELSPCELVGYLDDDEVPADDWVEKMIGWFDRLPEDVVAVGGENEPVWEAPRPAWLIDRFLHLYSVNMNWSPTPRVIAPPEWLCEGNVTCRRTPFLEWGGFPESLGRKGNLLLSGENYVMDMMSKGGFKLFFDPSIRVQHFIPASRLNKAWLRRRLFWGGVTASQLHVVAEQHGVVQEHWTEVDVPQSPGDWLAILSDDDDPASTESSLDSLYHLGYLLGLAGVVLGR